MTQDERDEELLQLYLDQITPHRDRYIARHGERMRDWPSQVFDAYCRQSDRTIRLIKAYQHNDRAMQRVQRRLHRRARRHRARTETR